MTNKQFNEFVDGLEKELWEDELRDYNEYIVELFHNLRNWGKLPEEDISIWHAYEGPCGDTMQFFFNIHNDIIKKARFLTDGCVATIAAGCQTTLMIIGKTLEFAQSLNAEDIDNALHNLPADHKHCAILAAKTLRNAILNYKYQKEQEKTKVISDKIADKSNILIRNYKVSDYPATLEILNELNVVYDIGLKDNKWRKTSGLRQFKPTLKRVTLVAEEKSTGEILCMGVIEATKNTLGQYIGYLKNWATRWEYIGRKVGKILAEKAIEILRSWGCKSIRISLGYGVSDNFIKIFKRTGFNPIMVVLEKRFDKEKSKNS